MHTQLMRKSWSGWYSPVSIFGPTSSQALMLFPLGSVTNLICSNGFNDYLLTDDSQIFIFNLYLSPEFLI